MKKLTLAVFALPLFLIAGCVTAPGPGSAEALPAPRLAMTEGGVAWENISSFGPVPAKQAVKGASTCASLNKNGVLYYASGYHSKAKDTKGRVFVDGGYYCVPR